MSKIAVPGGNGKHFAKMPKALIKELPETWRVYMAISYLQEMKHTLKGRKGIAAITGMLPDNVSRACTRLLADGKIVPYGTYHSQLGVSKL